MSKQVTEIHLPWMDICRLIAIFGVILIHISAPVFYDYRTISIDSFLMKSLAITFFFILTPSNDGLPFSHFLTKIECPAIDHKSAVTICM